MKSDKLRLYIIEVALTISLLCFVFISKIFTKTIMSVILLVFMIISEKLMKSDKIKERYNRKVTNTMVIVGLVYLAIIYLLGIYIGFYSSVIKLSTWSVINYIIPYIVIIVSTENIRKTILLKEDKKSNIIILIATVILDIALTTNIYNVKTLTDYYMLIGFITFASIANNMLFNYLIKKYRNCKGIIAYRIITILYVYIIPIIPKIHILFESILRMVAPYIIYLILEKIYAKKEKYIPRTIKRKDIITTSILIIVTLGIIMLISCQFKFGILVIGSGSMTGVINKTDAVIYKRLEENEKIKIGDIIIFKQNGKKVIHRVIDKKDAGKGMRYYTKGDANLEIDEGYREEKDIIGKVKLRIPYIGQPAIMLKEMFE